MPNISHAEIVTINDFMELTSRQYEILTLLAKGIFQGAH